MSEISFKMSSGDDAAVPEWQVVINARLDRRLLNIHELNTTCVIRWCHSTKHWTTKQLQTLTLYTVVTKQSLLLF